MLYAAVRDVWLHLYYSDNTMEGERLEEHVKGMRDQV